MAEVAVLQRTTEEPEQILRNALARCAEIRSRGKDLYVVVLLAEDHELPMMNRTRMFSADLAACLLRLQIEAQENMREIYSE